MAFRANEARIELNQHAFNYLALSPYNDLTVSQRERALAFVQDTITQYGPVISSYPSWHPLKQIPFNGEFNTPTGEPYPAKVRDHEVHFAHALVTIPYSMEAATVFEHTVHGLSSPFGQFIVVPIWRENPELKLYNKNAFPVLVHFEWSKPLNPDHTVPAGLVARAFLDEQLKMADSAQCGEPWDRMRDDFLGTPRGQVSSLLVTKETGEIIKVLWRTLNKAQIWGPMRAF